MVSEFIAGQHVGEIIWTRVTCAYTLRDSGARDKVVERAHPKSRIGAADENIIR